MKWPEIPDWAEGFARSLLEALRARDPYTAGHCIRVGYYSKLLARAAGLSEFEQRIAEFSGIFHDVGKIGIAPEILNKAGKLTADEEVIMQEHPTTSVKIISPLAHLPFFRFTLPGIRHHHERIDGAGYPDRIRGDYIPLTARIILIADTYDAMTTTRAYRSGLPTPVAYEELNRFSGQQFDTNLVKIFVQSHAHWKDKEADHEGEKIVTGLFKRAA